MHEYLILLGHQPTLSMAEVSAVLPDMVLLASRPGSIRLRTSHAIDQAWLQRMGGIVLIAKRVTEDVVGLADVASILATEAQSVKAKVTFSLRCIDMHGRAVESLGMTCKKHLKSHGITSRFVGNIRTPAKAIQLHDEGLLDPQTGLELVIMAETGGLWIGRTVAAQDVKSYTVRDMEKPVRDTTVGLLPPKLAQVMLNFGRWLCYSQSPASTMTRVLDPFCGTGVIPLEAMLQGVHVLASDVATKAITGTEKNVEWMRKTFKILKKDVDVEVWKQDATKPFALSTHPDVIVTEGSLGPALKSRPTVKDAEAYARRAADLTERFLRNIASSIPGTPIVMTLPLWYAQKRPIVVPDIDACAHACGFRPTLPPHIDPTQPGRFTLVYRRPDQFVGREIILLLPAA